MSTMDFDNDEKDDTKRKSRNLSEKKRRDQFNMLVNELSAMVSANNRKMDKSSVLKSTIAFLKNHNEVSSRSKVHEIQSNWKPSFLSNEEFTHLILEALDGFIMVFSSSGRIYYASEGITSLLGYIPTDLLNMSIYELVYKEDQGTLYNLLLNPTTIVDRGTTNPDHQITFSCYVKRGNLNVQESYEPVHFVGYFRHESDIDPVGSRLQSGGFSNENRVVFVGTGRLQTPQLIREMPIVTTKSEFTSRHSLEWKFLFLDHRAPPIIGYLPFEVLGTSGYDYYHFDDLEKVGLCHEALMQKGEGTSCFYRFLTKGQQWIWLQTRFYITYHQWNSKPEFVVCTHRVVNYSDAVKQNRSSVDEKENEQQTNVLSTSAASPWSRSLRGHNKVSSKSGSPKHKSHRRFGGGGGGGGTQDSDSTSMSPDSLSSCHFSVMSHISGRTKSSRSSAQSLRPTNQNCIQLPSNAQQQSTSYYPTMTHQTIPSNHLRHHQLPQTQMMAPAVILDSPQYVAAIPVQPMLAPAFAGQIIQPFQHSLEYLPSNVVLTPAQNQMGDHLQRRHEELQHLIQQQQEELRRVSEQLRMTRYGSSTGIPHYSSTSNSPCDQSQYGGQLQAIQQSSSSARMHQMSSSHHQITDHPRGGGGGNNNNSTTYDNNMQIDQMSTRSDQTDMMSFQMSQTYEDGSDAGNLSSPNNRPSTNQ